MGRGKRKGAYNHFIDLYAEAITTDIRIFQQNAAQVRLLYMARQAAGKEREGGEKVEACAGELNEMRKTRQRQKLRLELRLRWRRSTTPSQQKPFVNVAAAAVVVALG